LNNFHSRLKFTRETSHTELNFLDITILRINDNKLLFRHYKKDMYTGRIINFHSNTPRHVKWNTACNILRRWLSFSDCSFHDDLILEFKILMASNCYNRGYVNLVVDYVFNNLHNVRQNSRDGSLKYQSYHL